MRTMHYPAGSALLVAILLSNPMRAQHELVLRAPPGADYAAMAFDSARGEAILFGGRNSYPGDLMDRTFAWDGSAWRELHPTNHPSARGGSSMAYDAARQRIVLFGGCGQSGVLGDTWEWDGSNWTAVPVTGPAPRWRSAMVYDSALNLLLMFGGTGDIYSVTQQMDDLWNFNGTSWNQIQLPPLNRPFARAGHSMAFDQARQVTVLFGGNGYSHLADGDVWEFSAAGAVRIPSTGPIPRVDATLVDVTGVGVVMHGGSGLVADTWLWNGTSWTAVTGAQPESGARSTGCFDPVRSEALLWGGSFVGINCPRSSTWAWNGTWTNRDVVPEIPYNGAACFDAPRGQSVLQTYSPFGPAPQLATWIGTGAGWTRIATLTQPPSRVFQHDLVCDRLRQVCVMFSGRVSGAATMPADTWEWNGLDWIAATPTASPPAREGHGLAYDRVRGRVVLFGGHVFPGASVQFLNDTWEYDGTTWQQVLSTSSPSPRNAVGAMAFDVRSGSVVLGGGNLGIPSPQLTDTWLWNGTQWSLLAGPAPAGARLHEDDDRGQVFAVAQQLPLPGVGPRFDTWDFTGTGWQLDTTLPGGISLPSGFVQPQCFDATRGRLRSVGYGEFEVALPKASIATAGNPIGLASAGRPALGNQLSFGLTAPGIFAVALANAVVPGLPLGAAPWCAGSVLEVPLSPLPLLAIGTQIGFTIPAAPNLLDLPICVQAAVPGSSCWALSNTWVMRVQPN